MKKFKQLINPHSHSDYSLDGAATVKQIIQRNADLGATHVALTEHGNMNSAMELYVNSIEKNIKPILGIEAYLVNPFVEDYINLYKKAHKEGRYKTRAKAPEKVEEEIKKKAMHASYLHVTVHFKDTWAYKYFCNLSVKMWSRAIQKYDELKPMITIEELAEAKGHITITSSCMKGPVQNFLLKSRDGVIQPDTQKAEKMYCLLRDIAGPENFFVEIFPHKVTHEWQKPEIDYASKKIIKPGFFKPNECTCENPDGDLQKPLNLFVMHLAQKYGDKPIISLDSHFALPEQKVIQDARLGNGSEAWKFHENYYILSSQDCFGRLQESLKIDQKTFEKWIDNSYEWASLFNDFKLETSKDRWILDGRPEEFMGKLRLTIDKYGRMDWANQEMIERLKYEIQILSDNGKINLLPYFATVEDIADYCRDNQVLINVRGSAGGSLLLYLIGVSSVNPIKHGLSFERFLTEGRIKANTLPDVDIDVSNQPKVFDYLKNKYGDRVCRLSTDTLLKIKSSIKDAERAVLGYTRPATEKLCAKLPAPLQGTDDKKFVFGYIDETGAHHKGLIESSEELKKYSQDNPEIWEMVSEMLGIQRQKGTHACGIIITDKPVTDYMPIIKISDQWVTGFSPKSIESAGGVKYDILGLNTLRDIQSCLDEIKKRHSIHINPWDLPEDQRCFDEFAHGNTVSVFQFDTPTVRPYLISIKPKSIDDLAAITALCRPGTLDAPSGEEDGETLAELYVKRAKKSKTIRFIHKDLENITGKTMGIQLYQEQTLQIYRNIGEFSFEEAEAVRRGIGKKDEAVLSESTKRLEKVCLSKGWSQSQIQLLVEQIMASARYSFNKSHAISYAYVAYACMWLKTNYPLEWWKAILSNANKDEVATKFWRYVQDLVVLPDVNKSAENFEIVGDKLMAPLSLINGIGEKTYMDIIKHVPYSSIQDFCNKHFSKQEGDKTRRPVHTGIVLKLITAGALDSMFDLRATIEDKISIFNTAKAWAKDSNKIEPVPEEYYNITDLGRYMIRKKVVSIYSADLREKMLPCRGGRFVTGKYNNSMKFWITQDRLLVIDGNQMEWIKDMLQSGKYEELTSRLELFAPDGVNLTFDNRNYFVATLAYVVSESALPYKNKTKQATKLVLDANGYFSEEVLWPAFNADIAQMGYEGLPCLAVYRLNEKSVSLQELKPLLRQEEIDKLNVL
jgi:DNA polymerase-3 subunit alpha